MSDSNNASISEKGLGSKVIPGHIVINETQSPDAKWYIVHSQSGHEARVAETLRQRVMTLGQNDKVFEVLIPTQDKIQVRGGKRSTIKEKLFPGYILVKMIVNDQSWLVVRTTPGITGFVGTGNKPTPLSQAEYEAIRGYVESGAPQHKTNFSIGEAVKITGDHPFSDFLGTVDKIDEQVGKITVLVSVFGRETPVELDFLQVKKLS
jgi:transcriptional antiterminator NusG